MTRAHALALGWCAVIVVLASMPGTRMPAPLLWSTDSLRHVLAFAVVAWLSLRAEPSRPVAVAVGAIAFGVGIELWQALPFIGRAAAVVDALADAVGVALGFVAWMLWQRFATAHTNPARRT